jgi:glycosyltransferase involved in cell wall biosynthesis
MTRFAFFQVGPGIGPITNNNFRFGRVLIGRGNEVDLLGTLVSPKVFEAAPAEMRVVSLNARSFLRSGLPLIRYLRKEKPDVILASGPTLHVLIGFARKIARFRGLVVLRTHIETSIYLKERPWWNRWLLLSMMKLSYGFADRIVAASRGAADDLADIVGIDRARVGVLYNPPVDDELFVKAQEPVDHPWIADRRTPIIVTAARLAPQKALDVLLRAFAIVAASRSARLIVLGEGPDREQLEALAAELGIEQLVDFHGAVSNPFSYMSKADLFVLSSAFEGFANVVVEALACGCPVVSTDAPSGPREILDDGKYGRLVPVGDHEALAAAMSDALNETPDREYLKQRAARFHIERIVEDLTEILDQGSAS